VCVSSLVVMDPQAHTHTRIESHFLSLSGKTPASYHTTHMTKGERGRSRRRKGKKVICMQRCMRRREGDALLECLGWQRKEAVFLFPSHANPCPFRPHVASSRADPAPDFPQASFAGWLFFWPTSLLAVVVVFLLFPPSPSGAI